MNNFNALVFGIGLLLATANSTSFAYDDENAALRLAALGDKPGSTESDGNICGLDGVCNIGACSSDPDCPDSVSRPESTEPTTSTESEIENCDDTQRKDIRAVLWNVTDDWSNFDAKIEKRTSFSLGNCTRNRFESNGIVECMTKDKCKKDGSCRNGHALPWNRRVKIYPNFLQQIENLNQGDRRACYVALLTHEFAHSCDRMEGRAEAREDAALEYWKERFPDNVSSGLDINDDCDLD